MGYTHTHTQRIHNIHNIHIHKTRVCKRAGGYRIKYHTTYTYKLHNNTSHTVIHRYSPLFCAERERKRRLCFILAKCRLRSLSRWVARQVAINYRRAKHAIVHGVLHGVLHVLQYAPVCGVDDEKGHQHGAQKCCTMRKWNGKCVSLKSYWFWLITRMFQMLLPHGHSPFRYHSPINIRIHCY